MRRCDTYIHVPDSMLTIDLKVKCKGFLTCFRVRPKTSVSFNIGIPYLAHGSITIRGCVKYIHDSDTTLTFDQKVNQGQIYGVYDMALISGLSFLAHLS